MIFILAVLLFGIISGPDQNPETIQAVEFSSATRGYSETVRITPDSVYVQQHGREGNNSSQRAITKDQWEEIRNSLKGVKISKIGNMQAPSQERARDAALHSNLIITTSNGSTYTSSTFDDHAAPKPLQPLMKAVLSLKQSK